MFSISDTQRKEIPKEDRKEFSEFGEYTVETNLELILPHSEITIEKKGKNKYSYSRKDRENNVENKLITTKAEPLKIHLAPIGALHQPSSETKFMFLRFDHNVLIEKHSSIELSIPCPLEIGVFRITNKDTALLDCFSCQPLHSRYAIYGPADGGILCKYAKVLPDVSESHPYVYGSINVSVTSKKEMDTTFGKLVFPLSNLDVYYNGADVVFDGLKVTLKDTLGGLPPSAAISILEHNEESEWKKSPRSFTKEVSSFEMEHGLN